MEISIDKKTLLIILFLGISAVAFIWGWNTKNKLDFTENELNNAQFLLAEKTQELDNTKNELFQKSDELTETKSYLLIAQDTLLQNEEELNNTKKELVDVKTISEATKQSLIDIRQEYTVANQTLAGLGVYLFDSKDNIDAIMVDNDLAVDPTLAQLISFLKVDNTEYLHAYVRDVYDCSQFSRDLHNNAEKAGIRSAVVWLDFSGTRALHALNAFLTSDYGLVYVDDTASPDIFCRIKKGKSYLAVDVSAISMTNLRNDVWWDMQSPVYTISNVGVITGISIFW